MASIVSEGRGSKRLFVCLDLPSGESILIIKLNGKISQAMTATKIPRKSLERAVDHICAFGDTDVFPHLCEIHFLKDRRREIIDELENLDLNNYQPHQAIEVLGPKSRLGFRIVHQLHFVDTILYSASVVELGTDLENLKSPHAELGPFAYRFNSEGDESLFQTGRTYRDWLQWQLDFARKNVFDQVIFSDIADFYHRIYMHRIESCLDVATSNKGIKKFIEKLIKTIRSRQSYGIPVGGSASRLLAEAVLSDSDAAFFEEDIVFTRFVDDFRIFSYNNENPYEILSFIAEHLFLAEGLTLNVQKTRIMNREDYICYLSDEIPDEGASSEDFALETIAHSLYFSEDEPDPDLLKHLKMINLVDKLDAEISRDDWGFGKIKAILRALRITKSADAADYILNHLSKFLPFSKDILLFFDDMRGAEIDNPNGFDERIVEAASDMVAKNIPTLHAWLLEFFVRGLAVASHKQLREMEGDSVLSERQMNLIRGLRGDVNYFRKNKTRFEELNSFTKFSFILGASCLPRDEYEAWIGAIRGHMSGPLEYLYCCWAKSKSGQLPELLTARVNNNRE